MKKLLLLTLYVIGIFFLIVGWVTSIPYIVMTHIDASISKLIVRLEGGSTNVKVKFEPPIKFE